MKEKGIVGVVDVLPDPYKELYKGEAVRNIDLKDGSLSFCIYHTTSAIYGPIDEISRLYMVIKNHEKCFNKLI